MSADTPLAERLDQFAATATCDCWAPVTAGGFSLAMIRRPENRIFVVLQRSLATCSFYLRCHIDCRAWRVYTDAADVVEAATDAPCVGGELATEQVFVWSSADATQRTALSVANEDGCTWNGDGCNLNKDGCTWNKDGCTWNKDGCNLNKDGCTWNKDGCTWNKDGCTLNEDGCTLNKDGCTLNEDGCTLNKDGCTLNKDGCTWNKDGCTWNEDGCAWNKDGCTWNKDGEPVPSTAQRKTPMKALRKLARAHVGVATPSKTDVRTPQKVTSTSPTLDATTQTATTRTAQVQTATTQTAQVQTATTQTAQTAQTAQTQTERTLAGRPSVCLYMGGIMAAASVGDIEVCKSVGRAMLSVVFMGIDVHATPDLEFDLDIKAEVAAVLDGLAAFIGRLDPGVLARTGISRRAAAGRLADAVAGVRSLLAQVRAAEDPAPAAEDPAPAATAANAPGMVWGPDTESSAHEEDSDSDGGW